MNITKQKQLQRTSKIVARGEGIRRERERKRNRDCMLKIISNHSVYLFIFNYVLSILCFEYLLIEYP